MGSKHPRRGQQAERVPLAVDAAPTREIGLALWISIGVLILIPLLVFGRVATHELLGWDDNSHLSENPFYQPFTWENVRRAWTEPYFGEYVPVLYMWFAGGIVLSGLVSDTATAPPLEPAIFHVGSLLLHIACGLIVFRLLRRFVHHTPAACFGALVFSLHPVVTEEVAWVSEARGLLSVFFSLLALWHYVRFAEAGSQSAASGPHVSISPRRRGAHYFLASAFFIVALLAKPSAVAAPLIAAALDVGLLRRRLSAVAASLAVWLVFAGAIAYFTKLEQGNETIRELIPIWQRPLIAADALAFYMLKLLVPIGLTPDYGRMPSMVLEHGWAYWTWIVPAAAVAGLWWLGNREAWTAAAIFVAGVLPVLGLVPFAFQDISTVADRYVYLALLGPALFCAWLIARYPSPVLHGVFVVLFIVWAAIDWRQVTFWRDSETLFTYALEQNPRSSPMVNNMVAILRQQQRYDEALEYARHGVAARPDIAKSYVNLGVVLQDVGAIDEAEAILNQGLQIDSRSSDLRRSLAQVFVRQQRYKEAGLQYSAILQIDPENPAARLGIAMVALEFDRLPVAERIYTEMLDEPPDDEELRATFADLAAKLGHSQTALENYHATLDRHPRPGEIWFRIGLVHEQLGSLTGARAAYRNALASGDASIDLRRRLAETCHEMGRHAEAIEHYREVLSLEPNDRTALNNLAWLRATDAAALRDGAEAVQLAERLCAIVDPPRAEAFDTLAAAYAEAGQFDKAVATAQRAVEIAEAAGQTDLARDLRARLDFYRAGRPYRERIASESDAKSDAPAP